MSVLIRQRKGRFSYQNGLQYHKVCDIDSWSVVMAQRYDVLRGSQELVRREWTSAQKQKTMLPGIVSRSVPSDLELKDGRRNRYP